MTKCQIKFTRMLFNLSFASIAGMFAVTPVIASQPVSSPAPHAYQCNADPTWFSSPSLPVEVAESNGPGDSSFCDFYQFSWQTFAYLMAPSAADSRLLNFQDTAQFNEVEVNPDGSPANSCDNEKSGHSLMVRMAKSDTTSKGFVIPERIGQAGGGATIYDQNGNVVYYDMRFSKNLCDTSNIRNQDQFPAGTLEMKTAWKVMGPGDDTNRFITVEAEITPSDNDQKPKQEKTLLGMIGFHIALATENHPEFIWATFEHNANAPDCAAPQQISGWSFASESCTASLNEADPLAVVQCRFNNPQARTRVTGSATEICREYAYGSAPGDHKYEENTEVIRSINANVQPYLTESFSVLKNYFNVGALWVSDINQASTVANQRGSMRLANTVAETEYQNVDLDAGFVSNCFGCHNYNSPDNPVFNTRSGSLSHIFKDIALGSGQCVDQTSETTLNSQSQAEANCPQVCDSRNLKWNGNWSNQNDITQQQLPASVCGCCPE